MAKKKSAFRWEVPEGMHSIMELRELYTKASFQVIDRLANDYAKEGTVWMKANAPWRDRGAAAFARAKMNNSDLKHARSQLRAYVVRFSEQQIAEQDRIRDTLASRTRTIKNKYNKLLNILGTDIFEDPNEKEVFQTGGIKRSAKKTNKRITETLPDAMIPREPSAIFDYDSPFTEIRFEHGSRRAVPHSVWLELAHGGRYGIISRAVEFWGNKFIRGIQIEINSGRLGGGFGDVELNPRGAAIERTFNPDRTIRGQGSGRRRSGRRSTLP
jgi:hypothetical protein